MSMTWTAQNSLPVLCESILSISVKEVSYLPIRPAQFYLVHGPQLVDILSQSVPDLLQVWQHDDLRDRESVS